MGCGLRTESAEVGARKLRILSFFKRYVLVGALRTDGMGKRSRGGISAAREKSPSAPWRHRPNTAWSGRGGRSLRRLAP